MMDYDELVTKVIALLQREQRVPYRILKRRFDLDDDDIDDLKIDLIEAKRLALDEHDRILVWIGPSGETDPAPELTEPQPPRPEVTPAAQLTPAAALALEPPPTDAERRQLTVMFCDLVGSTPLSEQLDPEDLREVVRAYQQTCAEVVQHFDGHIAQFLGDALLVYVGWPRAHDDDAQRAVRTGLGMLAAMRTLNDRLQQTKGIRLAIRVGIHTGLVVVGEMGAGGHQEQLALGDTPNLASRIQGLAEPDTVAISEATYRLVEGYFTCQDLGASTLKGVSESQQVYRVLQESDARSRLDIASAHGLTPLVGREQEVGLLLERWERVRDGQGHVVILSGDGGIGKSRLVQVLKTHVTREDHTRLEYRSSPYYQNTALYPITEMLERTLAFQREAPSDAKLRQLEHTLSQYRLPLAETVPLFAPLLSLPLPEARYAPLNWTPQRQRQKTLETLLAMVLELSEQQPLLFILEDLHWTDPTTLEFLTLLMEQTPTASILTVLTCRPTFQPTWSSRSYCTQVTLNRLSRNQIARMSEHVAGDKRLPTEVLQQIVEKTDGVPLFVEEMTKAILESGQLKATNGHYELTGALPSFVIPATLQDSLMARLDRLMTAKGIAQLGAVMGRQFSYNLLQAVSQMDDDTLHKELSRLVDAELLYQRGLPPQAIYTFKHALIQDTAYESLLRRTRQQYHARIANVLEQQFPEITQTQPELLAHHYTAAGFHAPAVSYWHQASQNAVQRSAYVESSHHLENGLEVLKTQPETPERQQSELTLQVALGRSLMIARGYGNPEAGAAYDRARDLCQQMGEQRQLFSVLRGLVTFYYIRAAYQIARELGEQCLRIAQEMQDPGRLMRAHLTLGQPLTFMGEFALARTHLEHCLSLSHSHPSNTEGTRTVQDAGITCSCLLASNLWYLGYADQARQRMHEAHRLAQEISQPFSLAEAATFTAVIHIYRREFQAVQTYAETTITLAQEHGFPHYLSHATIYRGWALAMQGHTADGMAQLSQGLADWRGIGGELARAVFLTMLAEVHGKGGHVEEGLAILAEALTFAEQHGDRCYEAEIHRLRGELLLSQSSGNQPEAASCLQQAMAIAQHQHAKSLELRAATSLAHLWQQQGKRQDAYNLLAPVYGWFTEGFDTADLQEAKLLLDNLAVDGHEESGDAMSPVSA